MIWLAQGALDDSMMADELPDVPTDLLMEDDSTELPRSRSCVPAMENLKEVRVCLLHCPSPSLYLHDVAELKLLPCTYAGVSKLRQLRPGRGRTLHWLYSPRREFKQIDWFQVMRPRMIPMI